MLGSISLCFNRAFYLHPHRSLTRWASLHLLWDPLSEFSRLNVFLFNLVTSRRLAEASQNNLKKNIKTQTPAHKSTILDILHRNEKSSHAKACLFGYSDYKNFQCLRFADIGVELAGILSSQSFHLKQLSPFLMIFFYYDWNNNCLAKNIWHILSLLVLSVKFITINSFAKLYCCCLYGRTSVGTEAYPITVTMGTKVWWRGL